MATPLPPSLPLAPPSPALYDLVRPLAAGCLVSAAMLALLFLLGREDRKRRHRRRHRRPARVLGGEAEGGLTSSLRPRGGAGERAPWPHEVATPGLAAILPRARTRLMPDEGADAGGGAPPAAPGPRSAAERLALEAGEEPFRIVLVDERGMRLRYKVGSCPERALFLSHTKEVLTPTPARPPTTPKKVAPRAPLSEVVAYHCARSGAPLEAVSLRGEGGEEIPLGSTAAEAGLRPRDSVTVHTDYRLALDTYRREADADADRLSRGLERERRARADAEQALALAERQRRAAAAAGDESRALLETTRERLAAAEAEATKLRRDAATHRAARRTAEQGCARAEKELAADRDHRERQRLERQAARLREESDAREEARRAAEARAAEAERRERLAAERVAALEREVGELEPTREEAEAARRRAEEAVREGEQRRAKEEKVRRDLVMYMMRAERLDARVRELELELKARADETAPDPSDAGAVAAARGGKPARSRADVLEERLAEWRERAERGEADRLKLMAEIERRAAEETDLRIRAAGLEALLQQQGHFHHHHHHAGLARPAQAQAQAQQQQWSAGSAGAAPPGLGGGSGGGAAPFYGVSVHGGVGGGDDETRDMVFAPPSLKFLDDDGEV